MLHDAHFVGKSLTGDEYLAQGFKFRSPLVPPQGDLNIGCAVSFCRHAVPERLSRAVRPFPGAGRHGFADLYHTGRLQVVRIHDL